MPQREPRFHPTCSIRGYQNRLFKYAFISTANRTQDDQSTWSRLRYKPHHFVSGTEPVQTDRGRSLPARACPEGPFTFLIVLLRLNWSTINAFHRDLFKDPTPSGDDTINNLRKLNLFASRLKCILVYRLDNQ